MSDTANTTDDPTDTPEDVQQADTLADEIRQTDPTEDQEPSATDDADTFPREYVEKLRSQNARYRDRAKVADTYAQRLHTELVKATGRLADPSDLVYAEEHLDDPDTLTAALDALLAAKPHLASRRPAGDIGQGNRGSASEPFSLLGLLKERT